MLDFEKLPRFKEKSFQIFKMIPEWAFAYHVGEHDIMKQIPIAHAWCNANPKLAPKKDSVRFLNTWMRKAHEFGNLAIKKTLPKPPNYSTIPEDQIVTAEMFTDLKKALRRAP